MIRLIAFLFVLHPLAAVAQPVHEHALPVNAVGGGVPPFCAQPTAIAVADGRWSAPATWSTHAVPSAAAKVLIPAGRQVAYDVESADTVQCVEVRGRMAFDTDRNTKLRIVTLLVMDDGRLEVGTVERPDRGDLARGNPNRGSADRHAPRSRTSGQRHRRARTDQYARSGQGADLRPPAGEARASQTTFVLDRPVQGWAVGDRIVFPDTRQLRESERGRAFKSRDEQVEIVSVDGATVTVPPALEWDHPAAHDSTGVSALRPHVGNLSRNVVVASERAAGTRGHMMFLARADVDLRYVEVRDMGRTMNSAIDSTTFDDEGRALRVGTNQIGRYAIHFHHNFGPAMRPPTAISSR